MIDGALTLLLGSQNTDGGWAVSQGRSSNTEATSFALLALRALGWSAASPPVDRGLRWLMHRQNADGSWPLGADPTVGRWATPLAILAVSAFDARSGSTARATEWLVRQQGRRLDWMRSLVYRWLPAETSSRVDIDLVGWSWTPDAFGWVEPTAHAVLALKQVAALGASIPGLADRVHLGERFLYDRMCEAGGWNHGAPQILGVEAPPYPDVTALVLIALHGEQYTEEEIESLEALDRMLDGAESGLALALSAICLALYGQPVAGLRRRLEERYRESQFLGETKTLALGLIAMSERPGLVIGSAS